MTSQTKQPTGDTNKPRLEKGVDFYIDPNGYYVFTEAYLKQRGYCCQNGCRHCPYGFKRKT